MVKFPWFCNKSIYIQLNIFLLKYLFSYECKFVKFYIVNIHWMRSITPWTVYCMFPIIYKSSSACKYIQAVLGDTLSKHCEWHQNQCIYQNQKPLHPCKSICASNSYILVCKIQVIYCHINHYITDVNPLTSYLFYLMREWHKAFFDYMCRSISTTFL